MNRLPFTKYASKALNEGREIAGYLGFKDVSSIFVLLGLYGADGSLASEVLKMHGVTRELIEEAIKEKSKMPKDRRRTVMDTPKTWIILCPSAKDLHQTFHLTFTSDHRIKLPKHCFLCLICTILKQHIFSCSIFHITAIRDRFIIFILRTSEINSCSN